MSSPSAEPVPLARPRLDSIDWLRGAIMVLMALDHTRDFFFDNRLDPTNLDKTTIPLFLTRWVTHYCAPIFIFLTGVGAFLAAGRGKSKPQLCWFLLSRGLWIVALEVLFASPFWVGVNFSLRFTVGGVFWAIGWSLVALSVLCWLPRYLVLGLGLALIVGHNTWDKHDREWAGQSWLKRVVPIDTTEGLWRILHAQGSVSVPLPAGWSFEAGGYRIGLPERAEFFAAYPLVPWVGVMAVGYGLGGLFLRPDRRKWLLILGTVVTLAFIALRWSNAYGDPRPWKEQSRAGFTVLSLLNCHKYPPSLCYCLMTLGPALLLLAAFDRPTGWLNRIFVTFGRVPLFYYLLHLPFIIGSAYLCYLVGQHYGYYDSFTLVKNTALAWPLWAVYLAWVGIVFVLYWPCRWFAGVKQRYKNPLLSYL